MPHAQMYCMTSTWSLRTWKRQQLSLLMVSTQDTQQSEPAEQTQPEQSQTTTQTHDHQNNTFVLVSKGGPRKSTTVDDLIEQHNKQRASSINRHYELARSYEEENRTP